MRETASLEGSLALGIKKKKSIREQLFHYRKSVSQRATAAALSRDSAEPQLLLQLESTRF